MADIIALAWNIGGQKICHHTWFFTQPNATTATRNCYRICESRSCRITKFTRINFCTKVWTAKRVKCITNLHRFFGQSLQFLKIFKLFLQFLTTVDNFWLFFTLFDKFWKMYNIFGKFWQFLKFWHFWSILQMLTMIILYSCGLWDIDYNSDNWEPEFVTIFVTLDRIRNSCNVFFGNKGVSPIPSFKIETETCPVPTEGWCTLRLKSVRGIDFATPLYTLPQQESTYTFHRQYTIF